MQSVYPALAVLAAYLIGSLSFGVLVSRAFGLPDPRSYGSHNPGATNVLRSGKKPAAVLTLLLDAAKGALPVWLVDRFGAAWGLGEGTVALVGLAAFVGHLWPVFFGFRGGKGVATAAGVLLAMNPWLGLATLASFAIIVAFFRYVSLGSMVASVFAVFFSWFLYRNIALTAAVAVMAALLVWRHRENIQRLVKGTESKLGAKKTTPPDPSAASR